MWNRPHTYPPIPIDISGSIATALGWMLKSASKFEAQHRTDIEQAMAARAEKIAKIEQLRLAEAEAQKEVAA